MVEYGTNMVEVQEKQASGIALQEPGQSHVFTFSFTATNENGVGKCKAMKVKNHKTKVAQVDKPFGLSKQVNEGNSGDKRK